MRRKIHYENIVLVTISGPNAETTSLIKQLLTDMYVQII